MQCVRLNIGSSTSRIGSTKNGVSEEHVKIRVKWIEMSGALV